MTIFIGFVVVVAIGVFTTMRLRSTTESKSNMFSKDEIEDRSAAISWAKAAIDADESEESVSMQLQSTGWSAPQSKAIIELSKR